MNFQTYNHYIKQLLSGEVVDKKRIRSLMIIFLVVIIPGYVRLFGDAFNSVRAVDIVQLLVTGILTGILIMIAKDYFKKKKDEMDMWE